MIKKLAIVFVVLLIVVVGVVFYVASNIDSIAETALEEGGTYAMGVPTEVESVSVSLMGGTLGINGMTIANPQGFESKYLMNFNEFGVGVETGSLFEDVVVVPEIKMDGLVVNLEKKDGKSNVDVITENIEKVTGPGAEPKPGSDEPGKKVFVKKIVLTNITANVQAPIIGKVTVNVPELTLNDVSSEEGVEVSELIKRIWPAILAGIVNAGGESLGAFGKDLAGNVGKLAGALGGKATELIGSAIGPDGIGKLTELAPELGDKLGGLGEGLGKVIGGEDGAGKVVDDIGKGLGGLLGGDKKDDGEGDGDAKEDEDKPDPVKGAGDAIKGLLGGD